MRSRLQHRYCIGVSHRSAQATAGKGLAQGPYMAARAGVEPTTLRLKAIDSIKAPPCPTRSPRCSYKNHKVMKSETVYAMKVLQMRKTLALIKFYNTILLLQHSLTLRNPEHRADTTSGCNLPGGLGLGEFDPPFCTVRPCARTL